MQYVIDFTAEKSTIYKRLHNTNISEEIYVQTVLMNSEHAENMVNDPLRFMDWENGNGFGPAFLTLENYNEMVSSNSLFARKIAIDEQELIQKLRSQKNRREV